MISAWRQARNALLAVAVGACAEGSAPAPPPEIVSAAVESNPENVISAAVTIVARNADSVRVHFRLEGSAGIDSMTPAEVTNESNTIAVLGLLPERRYRMRAVAFGPGGVTQGDDMHFVTGALPADLPSYNASGDDPSPGYVVFAAGRYGIVIDNTGRVVWYRSFVDGLWLNFMAQANDRYVTRLVTPDQFDREPWLEVDQLGNVTRTFGCAMKLQPRFHDVIVEKDGSYWILCDEMRVMDFSAGGGHAAAEVTGTAVQYIGADGEMLFHWSPFDHFDIMDVDSATRAEPRVNWTHGNSLDLDESGGLLISFRNLNEITSIDVRTGAVRWRLGGARNEFHFVGQEPFAGQHSVRTMRTGQIVLLDNVGDAASQAEQWQIDASARIATLVRSQSATPAVRTLVGGSVQSLPGDRTLVSFGTEGRVEEYDAGGRVVWRIEGAPGYVFRAQRIQSLYRPGHGVR